MTDIEISKQAKLLPIIDIAKKLDCETITENYGLYKAKLDFTKINKERKAKLILVTAVSPTPYGEGKTTVSIGLVDALNKLNKKAVGVLREPSLGPIFGLKGGATGGGYSQIIPMGDINLNFTGDIHAITAANNLLSAAIDNHIYQGNELNIDLNNIKHQRCLDMNDRALKNIIVGNNRKESFNITAASEVMAIFCLSKDLQDLKQKLGDILIAYNKDNKPIYAKDLKIEGSMAVLLKDAIKPNLVQTLENNPVIIHGGPFANIAHGCNSIIATDLGLKISDYVVTEAGFGSDLGALKFLDIKSRLNNLNPDAIVLVATIKSLKYNGYSKDITKSDVISLESGFQNLVAHYNLLNNYSNNIVVCLNKYDTDTEEEINLFKELCSRYNYEVEISTTYKEGSDGAINLANKLLNKETTTNVLEIYNINDPLKDKISSILINLYKSNNIIYTEEAEEEIKLLEINNLDKLPICISKNQYSLTDNKDILGYPKDFPLTVTNIKLNNGAGFITIYLGKVITMPGLPKEPNYINIDIDNNNEIIGIF